VRYVEDWATESSARQRVRSEGFTLLLAILESAKNPRLQFDFVEATRGLEYVFEVRGEEAGVEAYPG